MIKHSLLRSVRPHCSKVVQLTLAHRNKSILSHAASAVLSSVKPFESPLSAAINNASKLIQPQKPVDDPFSIVSKEMSTLASNIGKLLGSSHPTLNKFAMYYFKSEGKHIRPLIVLTLSKALSEIPLAEKDSGARDESDVKSSSFSSGAEDDLSPLAILHKVNPDVVLNPLSRPMDDFPSETDGILPKQRRLAEIVEMIHTASLLHDEIIDNAAAKRVLSTGSTAFGNKMAILAGDFLLGRASVAIARLKNAEVIELLSTTISNLVEGEFMQLDDTSVENSDANRADFEYYIHRTYLKTASLMSKSCRASALLSGARENVVDGCYQFGRNLGICFQIVDDINDYAKFNSSSAAASDSVAKRALKTAPVLFAWEKFPQVGDMIRRQFSHPNDIKEIKELVKQAQGLEKTKELALKYSKDAIDQLKVLPDSEARSALVSLTTTLLDRQR
ncbi:similar to Saccharomyces cerevisiae YBR003W COQ1 Hexaprenyl pyrophosphate synthetase [Geotrichum candidum]|uniref:Similar to Saccharomyces cerevisiae YBR003W COQ1 Hexaprenyl pyrophosphate synthetase n=1 Tax=Geotrichum candidum TaxID=1173061 RepID=A0A0J9XIJ2_GEOCN|nr:similar to Saccharomyces cerevisiae YBR003W COQ1 Hexaprenyl pyrophosphate synthetase [Geotrichum candidum]